MKKQILALSLGLISLASFAQKDELKAAEKAIKKDLFKEAQAALLPLESMEATMDEKYIAKYYFLKGSAYGKMNVEKAAEAYNKLMEVEKESGKSKYTDQATPKLNELIQFVSEKAVQAYNVDKDFEEATKNFYLTYKLSPTDTSFLYNAAVSASLAKEYDTSLQYYKELQEIGYTGITMKYMATNAESGEEENLGSITQRDLMVKTGQYNNPVDSPTESKQADIVKNIGFILIAQGKTEEAIVAIQEARKSSPKDLNLILNEAQLYIKLDKMDMFGKLMEEAIELDPNNPTLFFNLGVVNQNEKKTEEAIGYYKKAIELDPEYGDAYMNLSVAILSGEQAIVAEMNQNLSNFKKYDELEKKQKALYLKALPYLEKADEIKRTEDTVRSLLNIYDLTGNSEKAEVLRPIYKKMRGM
ncbi:tetratricopeptide repeat protein [Polaribacter litorisediminis]|uniref:tetratricopeptide repeat protein n=1 Tax=Polaribacter litorisediminis TaxID=1908341 RepID=UPI001CBCE05E|nr:tetratricopeptide repeat protein [Polaribacter litorisediminis]UAM98656.1 tetratricopeptide repeat protein [Polaribacter litorisediminis]